MRFLATFAVLVWVAGAAAATDFHGQVTALYSFSPHKLKEKEIQAKSQQLDVFWSETKARGEAGLKDLRLELARPDSSPFFSYDGAKLLLSLSNTREDRELALKAIERSDLRDIQKADYFLTVHWLGVEGLDTSVAAFKILEDKTFEVFIVQHYLTLNQEMCLLFLLMPTSESYYLEKAVQRLHEEKDIAAQKSLVGLLASTVTRQGDDAIARFAADASKPEESRAYAKKIMTAIESMGAKAGFSLSSYESLKEDQRKLFRRVSDEALHEWQPLRLKLRRRGQQ